MEWVVRFLQCSRKVYCRFVGSKPLYHVSDNVLVHQREQRYLEHSQSIGSSYYGYSPAGPPDNAIPHRSEFSHHWFTLENPQPEWTMFRNCLDI